MKRLVTLLVLIGTLGFSEAVSQVGASTGVVGFQLRDLGSIRFGAPLWNSTRHLDRTSPIAALDSTQVYDQSQDANPIAGPYWFESPVADTIATVETDNSYSNNPPKINVRSTVYAWKNDSFVLFSYTFINRSTGPYSLYLGTAVLPRPSNTYGFEVATYDPVSKVAYYNRPPENHYVGVKLLSGDPYSFKLLDYAIYDKANQDSTRYWMAATPGFDASYASGDSGTIYNLNGGQRTIAAGDSVTLFYGLLYGTTLSGLLDAATAAQARYTGLVTGVRPESSVVPEGFVLAQNYPNPFNPTTRIAFQVPKESDVRLRVYTLLGQEVGTLVNERLAAGSYSVDFNARTLPSGVYLYSIEAGGFSATKRMLLVR